MNPYQFETTCDICGGKGMATGGGYFYGSVHKNPNICREILQEKANKLKAKEKLLQKKGE